MDTSNKDEHESTVLNCQVNTVNQEPKPVIDGTTEPDAEVSLKLKDIQMSLLEEELKIVKKTMLTAIEEMKEELHESCK